MKSDRKTLTLEFASKIYPPEAVMGAAYKMLDELFVHLKNGERATVAELAAKNGDASALKRDAEKFREEVLSQALRIKILKATRSTRDQILKIAITYAPFLQQRGSPVAQPEPCACEEIDAELENILRQLKEEDVEHDFAEDPLDILVPWEEKNPVESCGEAAEERGEAEVENGVCDKV
ncbi:MAG: hypothetical protein ABIH66_13815 [bacterium]